ncbi:asparagine synthase (glutamine-hydrolyzing) [Candidatus Sumerlaeota bacterium]|nr:asparagine synthase (glutamine-hydrolyzing) [Candidatus Sumerlaeota bacterium]
MCGFTGIINLDKGSLPPRDVLHKMNRSISHRGPDDEGYYFGEYAALGHRRLSIIDLAGGHQPVYNEDSSLVIVYNGEIYNFKSLRKNLEETGRHHFSTNSDTEVILHLYEEEGEGCLRHLNGMFSLALWDARNERLFCARDRMGQKPLYYTVFRNFLLFASELKALLHFPDLPRSISLKSLNQYLAFEYIPAPNAIFENISKLEPAHYFTVDLQKNASERRRIQTQSWWDIHFDKKDISFKEAEKVFIDTFRNAVERRLISDVPLGVFLSGGIDSSSVVAMMADLMPHRDIKSFCIAFEEKSFDESRYARKVAGRFGTDHREEILPPSRLLEILPRVCAFLDEPMADPSIIPTYLLSEFTRKHVTVALAGDGGDELFAGYDPFLAHYPAKVLERIPRPFLNLLKKIAGFLPVSTKNISLDFKVKQFLSGISYPAPIRHFAWLGSFTPEEQKMLLHPHVLASLRLDETYDVVSYYLKRIRVHESLDDIIYLYCKLYLQDDILVKVDRASMACSLEARAPFLDFTVVDLVSSLPSRWKLKGFTGKYFLKKAMEPYLPHDILYRRKKGFGIPIASWFKGPLKDVLTNLLDPKRLEAQGIFQPDYVQRLMQEHLTGKIDHRKRLWTLFIFQNWYDRYML